MKFVILMVSAAAAGALTVLVFTTTIVNPLHMMFDGEQRTVLTGTSPEQLGLHSSAVTLTPMPLSPPPSLKLDLGRTYEAQARSQIDRSIGHSQAMQAYTNNPSAWPGPPPN